MSNQARLLLLSGTAGSGTSSACVATVGALTDEGLTVESVDARRAMASVDGSAALVAPLLGLEEDRPAQWWASLPGIGCLAAWRAVQQALAGEAVDVVVVDLGDLSMARMLIDFPATALRIVSSALTADVAIRADPDDPDSAFVRLTTLRDELAGQQDLIVRDATSMRLVADASEHSVDRVLVAAGAAALQGLDVDGIIVNRCARKSDSARLREQHDALVERAARAADGPFVWKSTTRVRAVPKGRSAMGPLGSSRVLREDTLGIGADEDGFTLHLPLTGVARAGARVGRYEDWLVVEFDGVDRWLDLPSLLRRCRSLDARRASDGLEVRFVPDPALWRDDRPTEGVA